MSSEGKKSLNRDPDWKDKLNEIVQTCHTEIKKTTKIGMKMLSASQSNVQLHEVYEDLGKWLIDQNSRGKLEIKDEKVLALIEKVKNLENELESYEQEVQDIKKQ